jgi:replicative DNA helicase
MGKSITAMQMAQHTAERGEGVAVFSLEMTKVDLVKRMISATAGVDFQSVRTGRMDREERRRAAEAADAIDTLPLWIDETRARTIPAITSALRKRIAKYAIRIVVIDHLQLMRGNGRFDTPHHEFSEISHALKHLAGQFDVTVILLSQLNRECEKANRRPNLADLRETGSLEEDADVVLFVHRPEQFNRQDPSLRGQAEFIIAKQRNGPTGKLKMTFEGKYQRFVESTESNGDDL